MNAAEASFNPRARVGRDIDVAPPGQLYIDPFQSTRPRGARPIHRVTREIDQEVSIHAPAWGATVGKYVQSPLSGFQSTRPRGARPLILMYMSLTSRSFNPRARVGRDKLINAVIDSIGIVSIHAPAWGATRPSAR